MDLLTLKVYRNNSDGFEGIGRLFAAIYKLAVTDEVNANLYGRVDKSVHNWVESKWFGLYPKMLGIENIDKLRKAFWENCRITFEKAVSNLERYKRPWCSKRK